MSPSASLCIHRDCDLPVKSLALSLPPLPPHEEGVAIKFGDTISPDKVIIAVVFVHVVLLLVFQEDWVCGG